MWKSQPTFIDCASNNFILLFPYFCVFFLFTSFYLFNHDLVFFSLLFYFNSLFTLFNLDLFLFNHDLVLELFNSLSFLFSELFSISQSINFSPLRGLEPARTNSVWSRRQRP